jgi:hypothetical protein
MSIAQQIWARSEDDVALAECSLAIIARRMDYDPEAGRLRYRVGLRIRANTVAMAEYARAIGKEAGQHLPQRRTLLL